MIIRGGIDEIRFRNDENGYTILVLDCEGEPLVCVGTFPPVSEGEYVSLEGDFVVHARFGKQFKVTGVQASQPDTLDGIVRYLGSGLIRGIGPKTALAIVDKFGKDTFAVIEKNPARLATVKGVSKSKAVEIAANFRKIESMRQAMVFLQGHGIPLGTSLKIYKKYGDETVNVLSANPYCLVEEVEGIGFITADKIAAKLGVAADSEYRLRAGVLYTLKDAADRAGNTYLPYDELRTAAAQLLKADPDRIEEIIDGLAVCRAVKTVEGENGVPGIMPIAAYRAEKGAAQKLVEHVFSADRTVRDCEEEIREFERGENISLHAVQKQAIRLAADGNVAVITGGPGTGKTTIVKCILSVLDKRGIKTALMAPTGRAAKRMSESCGREASTIHRALLLGRDGEGDTGEQVKAGAVIVDEFSMVDVYLFHTLLKHIPTEAKLILVGDADQLPSVGAGNVLKDVISSGVVPVVRLERIYRQSGESLIVENAHRVNGGEMPVLDGKDGDFFFCAAQTQQEIADITVGLAAERIPKFLGVDPYRVQVLCPVKSGLAGSVNLNKQLQKQLRAEQSQCIETEEYRYLTGDKVMHIANNYNLAWRRITGGIAETGEGVFNGDLGVIDEIRVASGEIDVRFEDGRLVTYTPEVRSQLVPAYAITVHKSQGSEFDAVIIPVYGANPMLMTRNLLYTAITRAKRAAVIVGDKYTVRRMVENNYIAKRYSMMGRLLSDAAACEQLLFGKVQKES
ncbi:MAG: ATP-dependent RecD-like DNA helicase [Clostridia bacterium]|nr:ATP-dependent RecD-like DNA helicase [Clostridia bacterium]